MNSEVASERPSIEKSNEGDDGDDDDFDDVDWNVIEKEVKAITKCPGHSVTFSIGKELHTIFSSYFFLHSYFFKKKTAERPRTTKSARIKCFLT